MKLTFFKLIAVFILFSFFAGCASLKSGKTAGGSGSGQTTYGLQTMSGILWDVNTGEKLGVYDFKKSGSSFSVYVQTEKTRGVTSFDGIKNFAACEGIFEGIIGWQKNGYLVSGADENQSYYIIIHDLSKDLLPKGLAESEKNKNVYLLSVVDHAIYEEVFENPAGPRFSLHALKPFIRTHALIAQ